MNNVTKLTILFSVLVIGLTGAVFAYLATANWPDMDTSTLNLHLIKARKNAQKQAALAVPVMAEYSDTKLGISFKYPVAWQVSTTTKETEPTVELVMGDKSVKVTEYANPKMRKTLPEYLTAKLNKAADIDYKNVVPLTIAGKEAYRLTMNEAGGAIAEYDQVWVKESDYKWLAIGNSGAAPDVVAAIINSLAFTAPVAAPEIVK